ncbi:MAG: thermonuclease family protein [Candidatus Omnitrophota bacterium]|nr:thermonuclease family protein [Candidatus Omnitrophota bacterium]
MRIYSLLLLLFGYIVCATPAAYAQEELTVEEVTDGESLVLSDGRRVRLIGIRTPVSGSDVTDLDYGRRAQEYLVSLVIDRTVRTEIDLMNDITHHHDSEGRFLAYVYTGDVLVNEEMVREGYAEAFAKFRFRYRDRFQALEQTARDQGEGLWA